jgi:hypothetical protein
MKSWPAVLATLALLCVSTLHAQEPPSYSPQSYPDEAGYQRRVSGMTQRYSKQEVGKRCLASSLCPDTGLPVQMMAVEGETIYSPYTGRAYLQGDTGQFGPKKRDNEGRISAFGGDALRYDLPAAMARLLLNPQDSAMQAWLSVPGNLNQQYPSASVHWARFWPLLAEKMTLQGDAWREGFKESVSKASPIGTEQGEAHLVMGRTSYLLYSQLLGRNTRIAGATSAQTELAMTTLLTNSLKTVFATGNSEYDATTTYPDVLAGYLNLFDFSPKATTKSLAQAMLDYYTISYGLKSFNGIHAGATKRGWPGEGDTLTPMDAHLWLWSATSTLSIPSTTLLTSIEQATTTYRPNRVITNILKKNVPLPFEAQIARSNISNISNISNNPNNLVKNTAQETFYCTDTYALGSIALTQSSNTPAEQTVWSLVSKASNRNLVFGAAQPQFRHPQGHSLFDQVIQKRGALVFITSIANKVAGKSLEPVQEPTNPAEEESFWRNAQSSAATWLFIPRTAATVQQKNAYFFDAGMSFVMVHPFGGTPFWFDPDITQWSKVAQYETEASVLQKYRILVIPTGAAGFGGFALDVTPRTIYPDLFSFAEAALPQTTLDASKLPIVSYQSLLGDKIRMQYRLDALRAEANINGQKVDWANWAGGGVYASPYLNIKDGRMLVSDGAESYTVTLDKQNLPVWK